MKVSVCSHLKTNYFFFMLYSIPCKLLIVVSKLAQHRHPLCIKQRKTVFISIKKYAYAHFVFLKHLVCSIGLSLPPLLSHPSQKRKGVGIRNFSLCTIRQKAMQEECKAKHGSKACKCWWEVTVW